MCFHQGAKKVEMHRKSERRIFFPTYKHWGFPSIMVSRAIKSFALYNLISPSEVFIYMPKLYLMNLDQGKIK